MKISPNRVQIGRFILYYKDFVAPLRWEIRVAHELFDENNLAKTYFAYLMENSHYFVAPEMSYKTGEEADFVFEQAKRVIEGEVKRAGEERKKSITGAFSDGWKY